jgi:hypothetical protein
MLTLMLPNRTELLDHATAKREGWDVFDGGPDPDGKPQRQLQRIDAPEDGTPPFPDDRDAWEYVVTRARAGSALHRAALAAVDDTERMLIEAACGAW